MPTMLSPFSQTRRRWASVYQKQAYLPETSMIKKRLTKLGVSKKVATWVYYKYTANDVPLTSYMVGSVWSDWDMTCIPKDEHLLVKHCPLTPS